MTRQLRESFEEARLGLIRTTTMMKTSLALRLKAAARDVALIVKDVVAMMTTRSSVVIREGLDLRAENLTTMHRRKRMQKKRAWILRMCQSKSSKAGCVMQLHDEQVYASKRKKS